MQSKIELLEKETLIKHIHDTFYRVDGLKTHTKEEEK